MSAMLEANAWVWVPDGDSGLASGQVVKPTSDGSVTVKLESGATKEYPAASVRAMDKTSIDGVNDMVKLGDLHEGSILRNIKLRFTRDLIYTYTGTILIAVNPCKMLPLYSPAIVQQYRNVRLGDLPPHVFAVANETYRALMQDRRDQCVVISGESGAGKTESTKLILSYLTHLSGRHSQIEEQLLESSPVLEAFGNAKTMRNNNSSRFGKFTEIQFATDGSIEGARVQDYLLEKSRVVSQATNERNYHIFYNLLNGAPAALKAKLNLKSVKDYRYVNTSGCESIPDVDEEDEFDRVTNAMEALDISEEDQLEIFRLLSAVLHIGNIVIESKDGEECGVIRTMDAAKTAASLLGVPADKLCFALLHRSSVTRGEKIVQPLLPARACESREALAKWVYGLLFASLVGRINARMSAAEHDDKSNKFIGVLDIFGFEDFAVNSLEQFCINYANERLQQFFNLHIFKLEQDEYESEKVSWTTVGFVDNQVCLDFISKRPLGLLHLIDEECSFPKATDASLMEKLLMNHGKHECFVRPKLSKTSFGVVHYAGTVVYQIDNFLEKNSDHLRDDLQAVCLLTTSAYFKGVLQGARGADVAASPSTPAAASPRGPQRAATMGSRFNDSLTSLMATLNACQSFFVRCIKPNTTQRPNEFDAPLVAAQLRYCGMLETVRIRKAGFPVRRLQKDVAAEFAVLHKDAGAIARTDPRRACELIIGCLDAASREQTRIGLTKVFMKAGVSGALQVLREKALQRYAVTLQKTFRRCLAQKRYQNMRNAAITIQSCYRGHLGRKEARRQLKMIVFAQKMIRGYLLRSRYRAVKENAAILRRLIQMQARQGGGNFNADRAGKTAAAVVGQVIQNRRQSIFVGDRSGELRERRGSQFDLNRRRESMFDPSRRRDSQFDINRRRDSQFDINRRRDSNFDVEGSMSALTMGRRQSGATARRRSSAIPDSRSVDWAEVDALTFSLEQDIENMLNNAGDAPAEDDGIVSGISEEQMAQIQKTAAAAAVRRRSVSEASDGARSGYDFEKYARFHFQYEADCFFVPEPLGAPLLKHLEAAARNEALRASQLVMAYMGDYVPDAGSPLAQQSRDTWARQLITIALTYATLRDEVLCQIMKQLMPHDDDACKDVDAGCELLALCFMSFPPSKGLEPFARKFSNASTPAAWATVLLGLLADVVEGGVRAQAPSQREFESLRQSRTAQVAISVDAGAGHAVTIKLCARLFTYEVVAAACNHWGITNHRAYALFAQQKSGASTKLRPEDRLLDHVARLENGAEASPVVAFKLQRVYMWPDDKFTSEFELIFVFEALLAASKLSNFKCSADDAAMLAAAQFEMAYSSTIDAPILSSLLTSYLPQTVIEKHDLIEWETEVREQLLRWGKAPKSQYLQQVALASSTWPAQFGDRFRVTPTEDTHHELHCERGATLELVVDATGIHLRDAAALYKRVTYYDLVHFGPTAAGEFVLESVGVEGMMSFRTADARLISDIIKANLKRLVHTARTAVALARHDGLGDPEMLNFEKDDVIEVLEKNAETGWWKGRLAGREGWFLAELVQPIVARLRINDEEEERSRMDDNMTRAVAERKVRQTRQAQDAARNEAKIKDPMAQQYSMVNYAKNYFRSPQTEKPRTLGGKTLSTLGRNTLSGLFRGGVDKKQSNPSLVAPTETDAAAWHALVKRVKYSKSQIKASLVKLFKEEDNATAIEIFKHVQHYMGDTVIRGESVEESARFVLSMGVTRPTLVDEIFCQIIKQTTSNKSKHPESCDRGWQLLEMCVSTFPPTPTFDPYLRKHLQTYSMTSSRATDYAVVAARCESHLRQVKKYGARKLAPSLDEVTSFRRGRLLVKVHFADGSSKAIQLEIGTTAGSFVESVCKRMDFENPQYYAVYSRSDESDLMMFEREYVLDVIARHRFEHEARMQLLQNLRTQSSPRPHITAFETHLTFRRVIFSPDEPLGLENEALTNMVFWQMMNHLTRGEYRCTLEEAFDIAAVMVRTSNTDFDLDKRCAGTDATRQAFYKKYILAMHLDSVTMVEWARQIDRRMPDLRKQTAHQCKRELVETLSTWPLFGASFFRVHKPKCDRVNLPQEALLCVSSSGIKFVDLKTNVTLITYGYREVASWRYGPDHVNIKIGGLVQKVQRNIRGYTPHGQEVCHIISLYVEKMALQVAQANEKKKNTILKT